MAYRYETFTPRPYEDRYAGAIAGSLRDMARLRVQTAQQEGNANAQAALAQGQIWSQAIGQLGQIAGNLPGDLVNAKRVEQQGKYQDAQIKRFEQQQQQEDRLQGMRDQVNTLMADQTLYGEDGTINVPELHKRLSSGLPKGDAGPVQPIDVQALYGLVEPINRTVMAARNDRANREQAVQKAVGQMAAGVLQVGAKTGEYTSAGTLGIGSLMRAGLLPEDVGARMMVGLVEQPLEVTQKRLQELATLAGIQPPKRELMTVAPGGTVIDEATGKSVFTAPFAPTKVEAPTTGTLGDYVARKFPGRPIASITGAEMLEAKREFEAAGRAPKDAPEPPTVLTPAGLDMAALSYKETGQIPPLGMGDKGTRQTIINRAAELTPEDVARIRAGGSSVAANKADYAANTASLTAMQKQRDAIGAFEETALKNLDVFIAAAQKIPDLGSPWLNTPLRQVTGQGLGSADLAAFEAARRTVIPEFAKILANPTLAGQLSDSARHEVEEIVAGNASVKQILAVANILKQDTVNRRTSMDDQLKVIRGRISGAPATEPPPPPPPGKRPNPFVKK